MMHSEFVITGLEARPVVRGPIPGPKSQLIVDQDTQYIATTTKTSPVAAHAAKGSVILTPDGDVLLDFAAGIGVLNTGHGHPTILKAIHEQADRLIHFAGTDYYYAEQVRLAKALVEVTPGPAKKKVFFANSGTEANEAAMKLAYWSTKRPRLIAFQRAFHGRTLGALSLTNSKPVHRERYPSLANVSFVPFPNRYRNPFGIDGYADPGALEDAVLGSIEELFDTSAPASEVAAMFVEPVQGEGGYNVPPETFYPRLKRLLEKNGILLVADEVQTGFGRTGKLFAMEHWGVKPDVTTMAKSMASGIPMGAAVFDAKLDWGASGAHSNTFGGNALASAAALATLDVMKTERLPERAAKLGPVLEKRLREIQSETAGIGDVRGLGLMLAAEWVHGDKKHTPDKETRDRVVVEAYKRGLLLLPCGKSTIRFIPPLVVTEQQIHGAMDVFREAVRAV